MSGAGPEPSGGIIDSVRQLGATFVALLHTRIEIVAIEFEEERVRIRQALLLGIVAGFSLAVATLLAVMFLVVLFKDTHRLVAIGALFLFFLAVGGGCLLTMARNARTRPRLFMTTLAELAKDGERLRKSP
jgi:uncharacterized membrane protein YqjE